MSRDVHLRSLQSTTTSCGLSFYFLFLDRATADRFQHVIRWVSLAQGMMGSGLLGLATCSQMEEGGCEVGREETQPQHRCPASGSLRGRGVTRSGCVRPQTERLGSRW